MSIQEEHSLFTIFFRDALLLKNEVLQMHGVAYVMAVYKSLYSSISETVFVPGLVHLTSLLSYVRIYSLAFRTRFGTIVTTKYMKIAFCFHGPNAFLMEKGMVKLRL